MSDEKLRNPPELISLQLAHDIRRSVIDLISVVDCAAEGPRLAIMAQVEAIEALVEFATDEEPATPSQPAGEATE